MEQTNNLDPVLTTLAGIDSRACREVMLDYDGFIDRIQHKIYIQSFIVLYRNAEILYLKGNEAEEKKSLKIVLNLIEVKKIKNEDMIEENLQDYKSGTVLTSEKITKRLRELQRDGWI